jgi:hypothetical protein
MGLIERDGKRWTVADIDELERERDDYKDRWETLGRVSKRMIEKRDEQLQGAVEALLAAPMPEVESTLKGEEWVERYGEWWHEYVRPYVIGGQ